MSREFDEGSIEQLAAYYDSNDFSNEIDQATLDTRVSLNPMITTSLRLPKDVLDRIRAIATRAGLRPTQLMRVWIERALDGVTEDSLEIESRSTEPASGAGAYSPTGGPNETRTSDAEIILAQLLAALNRSQQLVRDAVHEEMEPMRDWLERREAG